MTTISVSSLSLSRSMAAALQNQQFSLSKLAEQLASMKKNSNLTDYSPSDARNLMNIQSMASERQSYINVITTARTTLSLYDTTLTDLQSIVTQALSLANNNQTYSEAVAGNVLTQSNYYLKSVDVDLNQTVNGRYIFSGSRYSTKPVEDLTNLPETTLSPTILTDKLTLPSYDSEFVEGAIPPSTSVFAYTTDKATIDTGFVSDYGITSNDPAIQTLIAGLRYLQAAGNSTDAATYNANLSQASQLLSTALTSIQNLHTTVANSINTMESQKQAQKTAISALVNRLSDIQQIDSTQVAIEITSMQAIMQASYSATGNLLKLSIVNYL